MCCNVMVPQLAPLFLQIVLDRIVILGDSWNTWSSQGHLTPLTGALQVSASWYCPYFNWILHFVIFVTSCNNLEDTKTDVRLTNSLLLNVTNTDYRSVVRHLIEICSFHRKIYDKTTAKKLQRLQSIRSWKQTVVEAKFITKNSQLKVYILNIFASDGIVEIKNLSNHHEQ